MKGWYDYPGNLLFRPFLLLMLMLSLFLLNVFYRRELQRLR